MALTKVPSNLDSVTATTQSQGDGSTKVATTAYVDTGLNNLIDSAPGNLNTLNELAAAMNDNASFFSTVLPLSGGTMTGALVGTTATFAGGSANNNDDANILTLNASQHARLLVDTSSTGGHRATLALESNGNETTLSTSGSASFLNVDTGNLIVDVAGDIILDAAGNDVIFKDSGTTFGQITNDSGNMIIYNAGSQMLKGVSLGSNAQFMGNVGVKVPSLLAFRANSNEGAIQVGKRGVIFADTGITTQIGNNTYITSANQRVAIENDFGSFYEQYQGKHYFYTTTQAESPGTLQTFVPQMMMLQNGDVGIRTASPTENLHIDSNKSGDHTRVHITKTSTAGTAGVSFNTTSSANTWTLFQEDASASKFYVYDGSDYVMTFDSANNSVAIGDTSPTSGSKLDITGGDLILSNKTAAPANNVSAPGSLTFQGFGWDSNYGSKPIRAKIVHSASYGDHGYGATQGALIFYLKGAGGIDDSPDSLQEGMRLDAGGAYHTGHPNLGINTSNIFNSLHVRGDVGQEAEDTFSVSGGGSTDYIDLYKVHGNYIRGGGRLRALGMENNLNVGYVEYMYAYSRAANGTYYINIKLIDEAYVNNTYARPRFYLTNSSSYNTGTQRQVTSQTANSTNTNILRVSMSNQANQYGTFQFAVEPFHWHT